MKIKILPVILALLILLTACSFNKAKEDEKLQIVSSFSIITDIAEEIGKDKVEIYNLVPINLNPHRYKVTNKDIIKGHDADIFLCNGLNLLGIEGGWLSDYFEAVNANEDNIYPVNNGIEPLYVAENGPRKEVNPHIFTDPNNGIIIAENIRNAFIEKDPDNTDFYYENTKKYIEKLKIIIKDYGEKLGEMSSSERILITSENFFQYLADNYDITEGFIWELDSFEKGTEGQINRAIDFVKYYEPKVLFVEWNKNLYPMEKVSEATGVEIYPFNLYTDGLGPENSGAENYLDLLDYNMKHIYKGLK